MDGVGIVMDVVFLRCEIFKKFGADGDRLGVEDVDSLLTLGESVAFDRDVGGFLEEEAVDSAMGKGNLSRKGIAHNLQTHNSMAATGDLCRNVVGELKGTLKARPVFHWQDRRIVGHLMLRFLAYFCEAQLTKALRQKGFQLESPAIDRGTIEPRPLTVVEAMRELCEVRAIPVNIRGKRLWVRTDIAGNATKLFQSIGLKIPPKVLNLDKPLKM